MIMRDNTDLLDDPLCIQDTFFEGVGSVSNAGSCVRIALYVTREGGKQIAIRLVCPADVAAILGEQLRAYSENGAFMAASVGEETVAN
jgi:hypothetical protein